MDTEHISLIIVAIVALGVGAQWLAWRTRLPAIVLLATAGLVVGKSALGFVVPSEILNEDLRRSIISLCVAIILFEGGLNLHIHELRVAASGVKRLVYIGAPVAFITCSLAGHFIGGLSWPVSLVLGAILVVTGPTVIMPLLRQAGLNRRTASYLKWEGIVNDPIGALLAVLVFQFFVFVGEGSGWITIFTGLSLAIFSGVFLGGLGGWLTGKAFLHGYVPEFLKSPVMLTLVLVVFEVSNALQHEAGLLAVTIMGMVIGNMHLPGLQDMKRFKEYITVMLVSVVFVMLTADIDLRIARVIGWQGVALIVAVLLVCRPLTIWIATMGSGMPRNDRILLSWIAPRGIVAAATAGVMGPRLYEAGYPDGEALLPLIFFVIFVTVVLHGMSIGWLARRLGLAEPADKQTLLIVGGSPWTIELAKKLKALEVAVLVADSSWHNLRAARLAGVPVFYGEILSDFAEATVEISHIDVVLSATSNDAYNALVCTALAPEIGRKSVYQLPMGISAEEGERGVTRSIRGKPAFQYDAVFERLWKLHIRDWQFYSTKLSDNYTYSDFLGDSSAEAMLILVLKAKGEIVLATANESMEPSAGDTLLYYAPDKASERISDTASTNVENMDFKIGI